MTERPWTLSPFAVMLISFASAPASGQEDPFRLDDPIERDEPVEIDEDGPSWRWDLDLQDTFEYDSNVFRLSEDLSDRLDSDVSGDRISGRFDDMDSEDDFLISSRARLTAKTDGLDGRQLRIIPGVRYDYFTQNERRSHPEFDLAVEQELGSGREIALDLGYDLDVFKRNYLADATDLTGNVSAAERVYDHGIYDELSAEVHYRHRLWRKRKRDEPFLDARRIYGTVLLGYRHRRYDSPFSNRDRNIGEVGLGLSFDLDGRWDIDVRYLLGVVMTDDGREVLIRDEPDFGVDLNGDGDALDENRRTVQRVDRSRLEHSIEVGVSYRFARNWRVKAGYDFTFQDYLSDERFDTTHRDREDLRHAVRLGVEWEFARRLSLEIEGRWIREDISRRRLRRDEDEETEYTRFVAAIALSVKLF